MEFWLAICIIVRWNYYLFFNLLYLLGCLESTLPYFFSYSSTKKKKLSQKQKTNKAEIVIFVKLWINFFLIILCLLIFWLPHDVHRMHFHFITSAFQINIDSYARIFLRVLFSNHRLRAVTPICISCVHIHQAQLNNWSCVSEVAWLRLDILLQSVLR